MYPMSKFSSLISRVRRRRRHTDNLVIESCPLHTERKEWAAQAPAQVDAACKRGADVIAFTEVHSTLAHDLARVCAKNGYGFFHDVKADAALAFKMTLDHAKASLVPGTVPFVKVEFDFHGSAVTVFGLHWRTVKSGHMADRAAQTRDLIGAMAEASKGKRLGFFMADSNPDKPLSDPTAEPRASLAKAGLLLVTTELSYYPVGLGVTTIGSNVRDPRVKAVKAEIHDALGSDHHPVTATYGVARVR